MCGIWWLSQEAKTLFKALVSQIGSQNKTKKYWKAREKSLCAEKNYHCLLGWNRLQDIKMRSHVEKHISECWAVFQLRNGKHPSLQSHESESKKKIIIMAQRQLISVRVIVLLVHKTLGFIASGIFLQIGNLIDCLFMKMKSLVHWNWALKKINQLLLEIGSIVEGQDLAGPPCYIAFFCVVLAERGLLLASVVPISPQRDVLLVLFPGCSHCLHFSFLALPFHHVKKQISKRHIYLLGPWINSLLRLYQFPLLLFQIEAKSCWSSLHI